MSSYSVGDLISLSGVWTDGAGAAVDPAAVFASYAAPGGVVTTLAYPADAALHKDATGRYHVDVNASVAGTWKYRFYSTGSGQASSSIGKFVVHSSAL